MKNAIVLIIYITCALYGETINGHILPPEPDPKINSATLLGIDSNNNGVRDDVERWIYKTYTHSVEIGLFMQSARAYQKVIVDPSKARETKMFMDNFTSCLKYWMFSAKKSDEHFYVDMFRGFEKEIQPIQFNTIKRFMAYEKYQSELSGKVYSLLSSDKDKCEFDANGRLK